MEEAYFSRRKGGSAVFRRAPRAWGALPSGNTGLTDVVKDAHYGPPRLTGSLMDRCGRHCLKMCTCWQRSRTCTTAGWQETIHCGECKAMILVGVI